MPSGPVAVAAHVQLGMCVPNWEVQEHVPQDEPKWTDLVDHVIEVRDGYLIAPDRPGIGIDLDDAGLAKHPPVTSTCRTRRCAKTARWRSGERRRRRGAGWSGSPAATRCAPRLVDDVALARLAAVADFAFQAFSVASDLSGPAPREDAAEAELARFAADLDALIVCHGAPYVSAEVLAAAPRLTLLGELDGDRFGYRLDLAAAQQRGVTVVDTTHGSSWPTAEWALGLALIGLRNAGADFRRMIAHEPSTPHAQRSGPGYDGAELRDKLVGMVGFGHLARDLRRLLAPFAVDVRAFDPHSLRASSARPTAWTSVRSRPCSLRRRLCARAAHAVDRADAGRRRARAAASGQRARQRLARAGDRQRRAARAAGARRRDRLPRRVRPRARAA